MKLFLRKLGLFFFVLIMLLCGLSYILVRMDHSLLQKLYTYQLAKIKRTNPVNTIFIGDSSLGSAIDGDEFSKLSLRPTINCALTGIYGYEGSYNMLKTAHRYHPELKNVVIMQTIDMQTRPVSFAGYVRTTNSIYDFTELTMTQKYKFFESFYYYIKSIELHLFESREEIMQNDYVRQAKRNEFVPTVVAFDPAKINPEKNVFLKKMVDYCMANDLNLVYVHGPIYEELAAVSTEYINATNMNISKTGVQLLPNIMRISKDELGDSEDHIRPEFKKGYTLKYYELINNQLRQ